MEKIQRPWGHYKFLIQNQKYVIKTIAINPKNRTSLQLHKCRREFLYVLSGQATIIIGDKTVILTENQNCLIESGCIHRLCNNTEKNLEILEVQSGNFIDENDIVRIEDDYGRVYRQ